MQTLDVIKEHVQIQEWKMDDASSPSAVQQKVANRPEAP
jgi:hypothetical protein